MQSRFYIKDILNQVYGEAASQIIQAYKGIRIDSVGNEISHLGRSLKKISNYKVHPDYEEINLKQQSGFSAELIEEARTNKAYIISGENIRLRTTDGIGSFNDTQYDHVLIDESGNIIDSSGTQMKFLEVNIDEKTKEEVFKVVDKIANDENWQRYDTSIKIPSEDYEGAINYAENKYNENITRYKIASSSGNSEIAEKYKKIADEYNLAKEKIEKSSLTSDEALYARKNPEMFVFKEVLLTSHEAGVEAGKNSIIIGISLTLLKDWYQKKSLKDIFKDITKSSIKCGSIGYIVGSSGTLVKSLLHSSDFKFLREVGNSIFPTYIVVYALESSLVIKKYLTGDIKKADIKKELAKKGVRLVVTGYCANTGAVIGSSIPTTIGRVAGGFAGSMIGYNVCNIFLKL